LLSSAELTFAEAYARAAAGWQWDGASLQKDVPVAAGLALLQHFG
jgi:hypothetical protein